VSVVVVWWFGGVGLFFSHLFFLGNGVFNSEAKAAKEQEDADEQIALLMKQGAARRKGTKRVKNA
jgi:hypothetical protein